MESLSAAIKFTCGICLEEVAGAAPLPCIAEHRHCRSCLQDWIATKVNDGQGVVPCPKKDCPQVVPQNLVRELCPELYDKYLKQVVAAALQAMESENETRFDCPTPNCPNRILVDKRVMEYTCTRCKKQYCPQCKSPVHLPRTCKEYFDFLRAELTKHLDQLQVDEEATQAYFAANGIKPCPRCNVPIGKISSDKYVTCLSTTCKGTTFFCFECGKQMPDGYITHPCS